MKLVAFCLFAVCCSTLAAPAPKSISKLKETLKELTKFQKSLTDTNKTLNTPLKDVEGCGCLSDLKCFREGILTFNRTPLQIKLSRSLEDDLTKQALQSCTRDSTPTCNNCTDYPTESVDEFFSRLQSRLKKVITSHKLRQE